MSIIEKIIEKSGENERNSKKQTKIDGLENKQNSNAKVSEARVAQVAPYKKEQGRVQRSSNGKTVKTGSKTSTVFSIDREELAKKGFLCIEDTSSKLSEEYRMIKRPLINNALNVKNNEINRANLILVTSSQPGEGKTFTAINLALSIASELDKKVLLVDADVAKPSVSKVLGINQDRKGLIDYLDGEEDFSEIMIKTDVDGLTIVPAGRMHGYSTELLASKRMALLTNEFHSRYSDRIVIFDSPPLLAATQAEVLAELVGQVVFVVEAERTLQSMVTDSMNKLKSCDVVLAVLNKTTHTIGMNQYGYGQYGH